MHDFNEFGLMFLDYWIKKVSTKIKINFISQNFIHNKSIDSYSK